ncbi:helix-turn-helix transcriptional regulator [Micromonospora sp. NPDC126480]|uniref:helix-turn-helix domain-containing protein n=1 Tax=Micromonospora sp. NPDC126480 TaxID=3155312 RepID=UPI00332F407A
MGGDFASIMRGLMDNRRLTARAVSRASGRAESTIRQLLVGRLSPTAELLQDIAPVLQIDVADLLVIAGLPVDYDASRPGPYQASQEIGSLVAAASWLTPEQVERLTTLAGDLRSSNA